MLAIRAVMRIGWEVPNPIMSGQPDNSVRFPFAAILPSPEPSQYSVTFTVKDNAEEPAAIPGATVMFSGAEKITNESGEAVFNVVENNTYNYAVMISGKQSQTGSVTVNNDNATVDVTLVGE